MKHTISIVAIIMTSLWAGHAKAQDTLTTKTKPQKKYGTTFTIGPKGISVTPNDSSNTTVTKKEERDDNDTGFSSHWVMMDLGFNTIQDKSNYNSTAAKTFLNVPAGSQNSSLFNLRTGKSINVNIYPFMETFSIKCSRWQQINISTGIGLQLYNFRYDNPINFNKNPSTVTLENTSFKKDKLAFDFLNVPLMITFKTRFNALSHGSGKYIIYGVGITGGYNLATWTKQESSQSGKVKDHNNFDFATFNSCLTGELGFTPGLRFYVSYQLTNLYQDALNQHPISFGFRLLGI